MSIILLVLGLSLAWLSTIHGIWNRGFLRTMVWVVSIASVFASATQLFPWFLFDAGSLRATLLLILCILLPMLEVLLVALLKHHGDSCVGVWRRIK